MRSVKDGRRPREGEGVGWVALLRRMLGSSRAHAECGGRAGDGVRGGGRSAGARGAEGKGGSTKRGVGMACARVWR